MEQNRTRWLILLAALGGLLMLTVLCMVTVGGLYLYNRAQAGPAPRVESPNPSAPTSSGAGVERAERVPRSSSRGNSLTLLGGDPPTLDPALVNDATSALYLVEIYSGLVALDPELEIVPDIARDWEVTNDGTRYTFSLRDDVRFHDGKPVSANDFKYSIERACDPATRSPVADTYLGDIVGCRDKLRGQSGEVEGVRVLDELTLQIDIDAPKVYFLSKLTYPTAFVVDRETIERFGRTWASEAPNGTGAFRLVEYRFGERLVLEPAAGYYGSPTPSVERVTYLLSGGSGMTLYETDEIDAVGVGVADIDRVLDPTSELNPDLREVAGLSVAYIGLNLDEPPFDDPLVRRAFNHALDKARLAEIVARDLVVPAYGILPPGMPGHQPDIEGLRFDPELARELLAQSSYGGPEGLPDITIHVSGGGGTPSEEIEAIVEMWRENLGVEFSIEQTEWATFLFDINRRPNPYAIYSLAWIADYPDPQNFLDLLFHCESLENRQGYCNPDVDALLERARVEQDADERLALYAEAERMIVEDASWVPLWFPRGYVLVKPWVKNFIFPDAIVSRLKYVEIEQ